MLGILKHQLKMSDILATRKFNRQLFTSQQTQFFLLRSIKKFKDVCFASYIFFPLQRRPSIRYGQSPDPSRCHGNKTFEGSCGGWGGGRGDLACAKGSRHMNGKTSSTVRNDALINFWLRSVFQSIQAVQLLREQQCQGEQYINARSTNYKYKYVILVAVRQTFPTL